jgi:two-component system KDP operon response regulator KdpE
MKALVLAAASQDGDLGTAIHLGWEGAQVIYARSGVQALQLLQNVKPDVVVLNPEASDDSCLHLIRQIRQLSSAVVVVASPRYHENDLVEAVEAGADDYFPTPISPIVFVAKIRSACRRARGTADERIRVATCGPLRVDAETHEATIDGRDVRLTPTEFMVLFHLAQHAGNLVRKKSLCKLIWDEECIDVYGGASRLPTAAHDCSTSRIQARCPRSGLAQWSADI